MIAHMHNHGPEEDCPEFLIGDKFLGACEIRDLLTRVPGQVCPQCKNATVHRTAPGEGRYPVWCKTCGHDWKPAPATGCAYCLAGEQEYVEKGLVDHPLFGESFREYKETGHFKVCPSLRPRPETPERLAVFLANSMKPEELSGERQDQRAEELLRWFDRYSRGEANPKWLREHAFELAFLVTSYRLLFLSMDQRIALITARVEKTFG